MLCCLTCFEFLWFCLGLVPLYFALFDGFVGVGLRWVWCYGVVGFLVLDWLVIVVFRFWTGVCGVAVRLVCGLL